MDDCGCDMGDNCQSDDTIPALTIYFNPFDGATIEENNERIRRGWEVMPMRVPPIDRDFT